MVTWDAIRWTENLPSGCDVVLEVTTTSDAGTSTELRDDPSWSSGQRLNALNQMQRQDVGGHTWLRQRPQRSALYTYTWDPLEDRLLRVQGPGGVDVNLTYDMAGRMLTRTSGGVTTTFLWDGWDCIRESISTSTTHYLIPEGQLLGFRRDGEQYSVASDALGCVRLVTDSSGEVVFRRDYGAFGETLPGGFDNVPGGMSYCFVGGLGVRTDADCGLIYMRQRWYCFTLQRFISRDQQYSQNRYDYAGGSPTVFVDVTGLEPTTPTGGEHIGGGIYKYGPHSYHNNGEGYPGSAALEAAIVTNKSSPRNHNYGPQIPTPSSQKGSSSQPYSEGIPSGSGYGPSGSGFGLGKPMPVPVDRGPKPSLPPSPRPTPPPSPRPTPLPIPNEGEGFWGSDDFQSNFWHCVGPGLVPVGLVFLASRVIGAIAVISLIVLCRNACNEIEQQKRTIVIGR